MSTSESSLGLPPQRLVSLDALRGLDMCWILGLSPLVRALLAQSRVPWRGRVEEQFEHAAWEGFHFYDLIFPLFLFIAGVSLALSLPRRQAQEGDRAAVDRLITRAIILFVTGVVLLGVGQNGLEQVRWFGVLQRIAIASCIAGLLSLRLSTPALIEITVALLLGYWGLLALVPVPDFGAGDYEEGRNLTNYVDRLFLPGIKSDGDHDPEGLLSTLPAIATALLGIIAGRWLMGPVMSPQKVVWLVIAGGGLVVVGLTWHHHFPVIKKLWTSSFVLVSGGSSAILLGVFYLMVDVVGWKTWTTPFVWVGTNPILLYVFSGLGFFRVATERLTASLKGEWTWLPAAVSFALVLMVARFLYKRGIYLRA